jgi:hypothetical protein
VLVFLKKKLKKIPEKRRASGQKSANMESKDQSISSISSEVQTFLKEHPEFQLTSFGKVCLFLSLIISED